MTRWEYLRTATPDLTSLGDEGWELIAIQNGDHIFKRPVQSVSERFTREQSDRIINGATSIPHSIPRILNPQLAALVRRIGHTQMLLICDRGFPTPVDLPLGTLDLSVTSDIPTVIQVLDAVLPDLPHDRLILAAEMSAKSPDRLAWHRRQSAPVELHPHAHFKHLASEAIACIRTGDATPYANVIVVGG